MKKARTSFLKKRSKNFCETALSLWGDVEAKIDKSFLVLFFKKEHPYC
jgi:hypothetical protein